MTSQTPYDTYPEEVINRAKFDASTPASFGGVKADTQTDRIALYINILDARKKFVPSKEKPVTNLNFKKT